MLAAAVDGIENSQNEGYSHACARWFPRLTLAEAVIQRPELR